MALFGFSKSKKDDGASETVMAYLEDAQRVRVNFLLKDGRKAWVSAVLQGFDESAGTAAFQVSGPSSFERGAKVEMVFILENLRIGAVARFVEMRASTAILEIPEELELCERRKQPRARINPKEGTTLTALTGLFEGVGITGSIENISESGLRVKVDKAINIKDQKRLPMGTSLVSVGHAFMLLKINKLPKSPAVLELEGTVAYVDDSTGGLALGIRFDKPRADVATCIRNLVSSRSQAMPSSLPGKARRKPLSELETERSSAGADLTRSKNQEPSPMPRGGEGLAASDSVPEVLVDASEGAVNLEPQEEAEDASRGMSPALLRLKKRSRTVLVFAATPLGDLLRDFLLEDGYGKVLLAATSDEFIQALHQPSLSLVLIDTSDPVLDIMELVGQLHDAGLPLPPVILAAEDVSRVLVIAAHRAGISHLLVKPYALDEALAELVEQKMGLA